MIGVPSARRFAEYTVVVIGCVIGGAGYAGLPGALSALIGGAIVTGLVISTPLILGPIMATNPGLSLLSAVVFFLTKIVALLALMRVLTAQRFLGENIDRLSLAASMGISAITWTILLVAAARRARVPIYDLDDDDADHA